MNVSSASPRGCQFSILSICLSGFPSLTYFSDFLVRILCDALRCDASQCLRSQLNRTSAQRTVKWNKRVTDKTENSIENLFLLNTINFGKKRRQFSAVVSILASRPSCPGSKSQCSWFFWRNFYGLKDYWENGWLEKKSGLQWLNLLNKPF